MNCLFIILFLRGIVLAAEQTQNLSALFFNTQLHGLRIIVKRNVHRKGRSFPFLAFDRDRAVMAQDRALRDR